MAPSSGNGWLKKTYWGFVQGENFLRHFLLLIIRFYWGALLVITGFGKLMNMKGVIEFFTSLEIPSPHVVAYAVALIEFLGGISLILGLCSRFFSLLLVCVYVGAYATAHKAIFTNFFSHPTQFITQEPFLYLYAALVILCFGSGLFSFDYWLEKKSYSEPL